MYLISRILVKEPLIITSARASCGCTVPQKPEKPVLPGEVGEINVTYNTKEELVISIKRLL